MGLSSLLDFVPPQVFVSLGNSVSGAAMLAASDLVVALHDRFVRASRLGVRFSSGVSVRFYITNYYMLYLEITIITGSCFCYRLMLTFP